MASLIQLMKKHRGISSVLLGCVTLGALLGYFLLPEDWHMGRRILGGGLGGSVCGLFIVAHRLLEGAGHQALLDEEKRTESQDDSSSPKS